MQSKIEGRIDKVEVNIDENDAYVNIIDYKSGKREKVFEIEEALNGVTIQLMLYLDYFKNLNKKDLEENKDAEIVKLNNLLKDKNIISCGSFYFWVEDPIISLGRNEKIDKLKDDIKNIESIKREKLAYVGVANSDKNKLKKINKDLESILYIKGNNKGKIKEMKDPVTKFTIRGSYLDDDTIKNDLDEIHNKIVKSVEQIKNGRISARVNSENNCNYCPYNNVCKKEILIDDDSSENNDEN